jgi:hypothetical protein
MLWLVRLYTHFALVLVLSLVLGIVLLLLLFSDFGFFVCFDVELSTHIFLSSCCFVLLCGTLMLNKENKCFE